MTLMKRGNTCKMKIIHFVHNINRNTIKCRVKYYCLFNKTMLLKLTDYFKVSFEVFSESTSYEICHQLLLHKMYSYVSPLSWNAELVYIASVNTPSFHA